MTVFDFVVLAVIVISAAFGGWRGFAGELLALAAWVLAVVAAWMFGEEIGQAVFGNLIDDVSMRLVAGFVAVAVLVLFLAGLIRFAVREFIKAVGLTPTDRALGVLFGLSRGLAIVVVLVALGGLTPMPKEKWWRQAVLSAPTETLVVALKPWLPDGLARRIRF
ncbi:MAG TPA: CvpA family protein [Rhodocyclaceae bacterium]